jgi:carboxyl-terminal processing protease
MEIWNRFIHGEFDNQDSIQLADSLIFHTPQGRVVYGGGGIMPDIFVSRDTTAHTPYLNQVFGFIHQYAFQYTDRNREKLNTFATWQVMEQHLDNQNLLNNFVSFAESKGVKPNWQEINKSKQFIERQLKALIVRNILGESEFFPLINQDDPTVQRALKELRTNEMFK